ncbi:hypothetical protein [Hydrogenophaga sp. BPS33]|uniref:hypothetical protein n=1 Tax=Hydrogenophaga sp. BPS33 TaxID=2651974 RepID=UPI0013204493|nr:hypothetical protein [Hydrogenophaga sp. BPS33]QHE83589.1 hypothetical protein F9K07_01195 [Hydrogenophaga sp. BPS33]
MPSRFRLKSPLSISDFERRSVKLMAACALGLAGIAHVQVAPPTRQAIKSFTPARLADASQPVALSRDVIVNTPRR